jgi:2-oxoisovalerate dehydrogenase E1 component alpha subunit
MYRHMVRARVLDERMWVLNRQGRAPFWVSGMGHEAVQVAIGVTMRAGVDWCVPYYRDLALTLVLGMAPRDHLLSVLAKAGDPNSGGRQMPAHYGSRRHHIMTTGAVVATQLLHGAGIALASKMRNEDAVTVTCSGEGGTSEGDFHEALNFAALNSLPFVCLIENNGYAISVPWNKQTHTEHVADRGASYGMPGVKVDGNDVVACYQVAREAVERARHGGGPTLIEAKVARLTSHSSDDDQRRYRSSEAIEADRRNDCIVRFRHELEQSGVLRAGDAEEIRAGMVRELDQAQEQADAAPLPDAATALRHVVADEGAAAG